jgi:hypothetical protein
MKLDHESFLAGLILGYVAHGLLVSLWSLTRAVWGSLKDWRMRRKWKRKGAYRWESIPDHPACRCTKTPDGYSVLDDTEETPT